MSKKIIGKQYEEELFEMISSQTELTKETLQLLKNNNEHSETMLKLISCQSDFIEKAMRLLDPLVYFIEDALNPKLEPITSEDTLDVENFEIEAVDDETTLKGFLKELGKNKHRLMNNKNLSACKNDSTNDQICGIWTPLTKKELPNIHISKIEKGSYTLRMIDDDLGIEYCSVSIDLYNKTTAFIAIMDVTIALEFKIENISQSERIILNETEFVRIEDENRCD